MKYGNIILRLMAFVAMGGIAFTSQAAEPAASQESAPVAPAATKLVIQPSSSSLKGGKAHLTTTPLNRKAEAFVGSYQIKVVPYFFKNETGSIHVKVPQEALRQLRKGTAMNFGGEAVTTGTGERRPLEVHAEATEDDRGRLVISIHTENGVLRFDSAYRFGT
jgi:hypothetical protein